MGGSFQGCPDVEFTRACDDEPGTFPILLVVGAPIGMFGFCICTCWSTSQRKRADAGLTALCGTLTAQSQSSARWEYITFQEGPTGQNTCIESRLYKCVAVTGACATWPGGAQAMPIVDASTVATNVIEAGSSRKHSF